MKHVSTVVYDCLLNNVCDSFTNCFKRMAHRQNTRNNNSTVEVPKMKTEYGRKSFSVTAARTFNNISSMCAVSDSDIGCHSMVFVFDGSEMNQLNRSQFHPVCQ